MSVGDLKELEIKNALCWYLRRTCVLEGSKELVDDKVRDMASDIYDLFFGIIPYPEEM